LQLRWVLLPLTLAAACGDDSAVIPDAAPNGVDAALPDATLAPDGPVPGCTTSGGNNGATNLQILSMDPPDVPLHGNTDVVITYSGELPANFSLRFNDQFAAVDAVSSSTIRATTPSTSTPTPIRLSIWGQQELAWLTCAGQYISTPPSGMVSPNLDGFTVPLHPEVNRPCARMGSVYVSNTGDQLMRVQTVALTGSAEFSISSDTCSGATVPYGVSNGCGVNLCFSSTIPMQHMAQLSLPTNAGTIMVPLTQLVLSPSAGLDASFGNGGAVLVPQFIPGRPVGEALLSDGTTVAVWERRFNSSFTEYTATGTATNEPIGTFQYDPSAILRHLRAAPPGHGIYAQVGDASYCNDALVHFADDATRDTGFGEVVFPSDGFICDSAIELQSTGRVLVLGDYIVAAYSATGAADTTFGTNGAGSWSWQTYGEFLRASASATALDGQDRLYAATMSGVVRLLANGTFDTGFNYLGPVGAITLDANQHLLVAHAGGVSRLDDTGAATALSLGSAPGVGDAMTDIDLDSSGRLYLTTSTGNVLRFLADGSFDATIGFEGAQQVVCEPSGACSIAGATPAEGYLIRTAP
jgi:hypothetical protein